jgi:hypothetical protein
MNSGVWSTLSSEAIQNFQTLLFGRDSVFYAVRNCQMDDISVGQQRNKIPLLKEFQKKAPWVL